MEKYIKIPTSDGFEINGILNWKEKSEKLIIFVHGLTGDMYEPHYYAGKEYFQERGFEVFRFNFYDGKEIYRNLKNSSISTHAVDLENILNYFSEHYSQVYIASHSLGCPSILRVKSFPKNIKKLIYWDPAFDNYNTGSRFLSNENLLLFDANNGKHIQVSEEMKNERSENHIKILDRMNFPVNNMHIIYAGRNNKKDLKPQTDALGIESYIIQGANHGFTQEGKYEELFEKTLEFIEQ